MPFMTALPGTRLPGSCLAALLLAGLLLLGACTGPTPYQPAGAGAGSSGYGYSDRRLEGNRFLVEFDGNASTSREDVELYLLYRAAQITLGTGNDFFVLVQRSTDADTRYVSNTAFYDPPYGGCWRGGPWYPYGWGPPGWGPGWGAGWGWRSGWGPGWGAGWGCGPMMGTTTTTPVTRYSAQAEILVFPGRTPRGDPNAYDAREIVANLGPHLRRPT